jgi:hypothetical protein
LDQVSAVIVTRGDHDLSPILDSLPYEDIVVWDNSVERDLGIYGRYAAISRCKHSVIYTQDDDCIVRCHEELLENYRNNQIIANNDELTAATDPDLVWLARGAMFRRDLPNRAFERMPGYLRDWTFRHQTCDIYFAMLTPFEYITGAVENLDYAYDPGRVSTSDDWWQKRAEAKRYATLLATMPTIPRGAGPRAYR